MLVSCVQPSLPALPFSNIVSIHGLGAHELSSLESLRNSAFVVMEGLQGGDLRMRLLKQVWVCGTLPGKGLLHFEHASGVGLGGKGQEGRMCMNSTSTRTLVAWNGQENPGLGIIGGFKLHINDVQA